MADDDVNVKLKATGQSAFSRVMRGAAKDVGSIGDKARRASGSVRLIGSATASSARGLRLMAGGAFTGAAALAALGGLGAKHAIGVATDIAESSSKNTVLFGKYAAGIERFASTSAQSMGISKRAALESTGTFGNLFRALDIAPKKASGMSVSLTKLAGDLASFNNATPEEALEAIRSGLVGETEPLRRFGVNLNDDALRAEALRQGLVKTTKEALTPQQKALAVNALLFKQTSKAQGDFKRTSGGLANQQRILKASVEDVAGSLGKTMLPAATSAVSFLNREVVPEVKEASRAINEIWGTSNDLTTAEKFRATGETLKTMFRPLESEARTFWSRNREAIISGAQSAVASAGARMADAAAAAAPHAASAFVSAFKGAGPWGQLLTVALVSKKLGVFTTLGRLAAGSTCTSFGSKLPGCMQTATGGKGGGKLATAFRTLGRFGGPLAAGVFLEEFIRHFTSQHPERQLPEAANPESGSRTHKVQPGDPSGADIAGRRLPRDPGPSAGGSPFAPGPIAPLPGRGPGARSASVPTLGRNGVVAAAPVYVVLDAEGGRVLGKATAKWTADDLARM